MVRTRSEVAFLKQQNELLKTTNQKIEDELLKNLETRRQDAELQIREVN